ncbi:hypothetical protein ABIE13_001546 [Ottowia thiooxydans]|uniref:Secreted protein n=1 Tax=Ottowia thiooxydans TaxID=219182 RepID=A0ABV2Q5Z2_9BURK
MLRGGKAGWGSFYVLLFPVWGDRLGQGCRGGPTHLGKRRLSCPRRLLVASALALRSEAGECARRRTYSFCSAKNSRPKKAAPSPCPFAALRASSGARSRGGAAELATFASLNTLKQLPQASSRSKSILQCSCPPLDLRSSARPKGWDTHSGHCFARPGNCESEADRARPYPATFFLLTPPSELPSHPCTVAMPWVS